MAKAFTCDGCGVPVAESDMAELGLMLKSQYCPACAPLVQKMLADIDDLHTRAAAMFAQGRKLLLAEFRRDHAGFRELPDSLMQFAPIEGESTDA
jgi:hypothetical protein